MASGLQDTEHLNQSWHENWNNKQNAESACKKRTYNICGSRADSTRSANMEGQSIEEMLCSQLNKPKKVKYARSSSVSTSHTDGLEQRSDGSKLGGVDYSVIKAMSQFYPLVRRIKEHNRIDLNTRPSEEEDWQNEHTHVDVRIVEGARSPWEFGGVWDYNERTACDLSDLVDGCAISGDRPINTM